MNDSAKRSDAERLREALEDFLGYPITASEVRLLQGVLADQRVDYSSDDPALNDPRTADEWDDDRVIRAGCVQWLLTDRRMQRRVPRRGVRIQGARIDGLLDLEYADIPFPIEFQGCSLDKGLILAWARLKALSLRGGMASGIIASGLRVMGDLDFGGGLTCSSGLVLRQAVIHGSLDCSGGEFHNAKGNALLAQSLQVTGSVFLDEGFKAAGRVSLPGATIGGQLVCSGGEFHNAKGDALLVQSLQVTGDVVLGEGFKAEGMVSLLGATIGGQLVCSGGEFHNAKGNALLAQSLQVTGSVVLNEGFKAEGMVSLAGATIGGGLVCLGGEFHNAKGDALLAQSLQVTGSVFLNEGFKAEGMVSLSGATIGGQLICSGGEFHNAEGVALLAQSLQVTGDVFLREGFKAEGMVSLAGATIGGQLVCLGGEFHNAEGDALLARSLQVTGDVVLDEGFKAEGMVSLAGATIGGVLVCRGISCPDVMSLDLQHASVQVLFDETASWPRRGHLSLQGFHYARIHGSSPVRAAERIRWLQLQPQFHPQPYEQLASTLRASGYEDAAKAVQIAKHDEYRRRGGMPPLANLFHWLLKLSTGYGYKPYRPLFSALFLIAIGAWLFYAGSREGIMMSTCSDGFVATAEEEGGSVHPYFHPVLYSIDVFLPVISFGHAEHWTPNETQAGYLVPRIPLSGLALRSYGWFLNVSGWVLTTLFIATLSGTITRRLGPTGK